MSSSQPSRKPALLRRDADGESDGEPRTCPDANLVMYMYFPFAVVCIAIYVLLPWRASSILAALTGLKVRVRRLYACNHRMLLEPIGIASPLGRPVAAVT